MIKLSRNPLPVALEAQVAVRVQRLKEHLDNGEEVPKSLLDAYRNPAVKEHLVAEAYGKCVYCESKITHVYFGDVEHIKPKALFPAERLDISNLTLACALCNNAKGDYWDDHLPLLNPFTDDPSEELLCLGYLLARRPGSARARLTIERLQLNRQALLERRRERIELLQPLADQYAQAAPGPLKNLLEAELRRQAQSASEYTMIVRTYLAAACGIHVD